MRNEEIKVSIIMPVYNVEKYVGRAIESIQNQTLKEFEFLIVDDGTPDRSGKICDRYAKQDSRLKVIHKENGGAPSARNAAIDIAKGEFLYFMDSDDWVEPTMLQDMYDFAKKNHSQMVIAGFYIDTYYSDEKYVTSDYRVPTSVVYQSQSEFRKNAYKLFDRNLLYTPWNKLIERAYIMEHEIRFPNTFWDDFPFNLYVVRDIERVSVMKQQYYHFIRARAESETAAYRDNMYEKREEEHQWMVDLYKYWQIRDSRSLEMIARRYIERFVGCIENLTNPKCTLTYKEKCATIKEMLKNRWVVWSLKRARPKSKYMKLMLLPIRWKNIWLILLEAKCISFVKSRNVKLFALLKAGR